MIKLIDKYPNDADLGKAYRQYKLNMLRIKDTLVDYLKSRNITFRFDYAGRELILGDSEQANLDISNEISKYGYEMKVDIDDAYRLPRYYYSLPFEI